MSPSPIRTILATLLGVFCLSSTAQTEAPASAEKPAFVLDIQTTDDTLRALLERHLTLQRYRVLSDLTESELQDLLQQAPHDAARLLATEGYFSPQIAIQQPPVKAGQVRALRLEVEPGPPTRVSDVRLQFEGAIAQDADGQRQSRALEDNWQLPEGERFTQAGWERAKEQTLRQLQAQRFANASLRSAQADIDADQARAALQVAYDSGPAYTLGGLEVRGAERYGADLVQRLARLPMGQPYTAESLADGQKQLTDSGYFDSAVLTLDPASDPAHAVVQALVTEAPLHKWVLGVGASTDTGARWSVEHTHHQVPVLGWRAVHKLSSDRSSQAWSSDWTSPPDDSQWRWAASTWLAHSQVALIDMHNQRLRFGRFTSQAERDQSYYLQYERADVRYLENQDHAANEAASVTYAFALRRFDSVPFPSRGWGLGAEASAGSVLGSAQEPYSRFLLHARAYQPLAADEDKRFNRQRAGRMVYRAQVGAVLVNNATSVPFTQLFLTGGDTSVRGYRRDEIGVTHQGVLSAEAGRYLATASLEWQRPIVQGGVMTDWEGALFVDTGAVANRTEDFSFKVGLGVGARWKSPIGPLQMDLAYGVATEALRLHLNVGFVF